MDSIWNDPRIYITVAVAVISALSGIIAWTFRKDQDRLYEKDREQDRKLDEISEKIDKKFDEINEKIDKEFRDNREEINNMHSILSGHMQYHQGLQNGGSK